MRARRAGATFRRQAADAFEWSASLRENVAQAIAEHGTVTVDRLARAVFTRERGLPLPMFLLDRLGVDIAPLRDRFV